MKDVQLQSTEEVPVVCLADGTIIQPFGYICESMGIYNEESKKAGQKYINIPEVRACVMPKLSADLILGIDFFSQHDITFKPSSRTLLIPVPRGKAAPTLVEVHTKEDQTVDEEARKLEILSESTEKIKMARLGRMKMSHH